VDSKAAILITNFHPGGTGGGGHNTYIKNIFGSSLAETYSLALASPPGSSLSRWAREARIRRFDMDFPGAMREIPAVVRSIFRLQEIYRAYPFQLLHANGSRDHWIALYWKMLFRRPARIVRTRHAFRHLPGDPLHRLMNNRLTASNIFVSRALYEESGASRVLRNAVVMSNGVDLKRFQPTARHGETARELGLAQDDFVFGSVAGTAPYKRVDQFLRAFARAELKRKAKILVVGDEANGRRLTRLARDLGLEQAFIYGGYRAEVRPVISLFDVGFVLSDAVETSSFAAKEMLAMGVPLISSTFCGLVENVDHGVNGFLVNPHNLEEIAGAITRFASMPEADLAAFRRAAREKAERCFSLERQMELLHRLYQEVLEAPSGLH